MAMVNTKKKREKNNRAYALVQSSFYLQVGEVKWNCYTDALEEECSPENMKEEEGGKLYFQLVSQKPFYPLAQQSLL